MTAEPAALARRATPGHGTNTLTEQLRRLAASGTPVLDLTETNPTAVGLAYPDDALAALGDPRSRSYEPEPFGLASARAAVAADAARRGATVAPDDVVLTASSSESYSWLFKLCCDPGEHILVPRPSYPLFEHLARLEGVHGGTYTLEYHGRWEVDLDDVARGLAAGARLVVAVSPNNPTGSMLTAREADALVELTARHGATLVVDEVFADYAVAPPAGAVTDVACRAAHAAGALVVTLGGLSKSAGLPQVKLGWMTLGGVPGRVRQAREALELIADSYLSVSTPVQHAAPALLAVGAAVRQQIQARVAQNLGALRTAVAAHPACTLLPVEGGWSAVLRVPATRPEEQLVLELLERDHVLVHPGYFFDFPVEAFLMVSLLPEPAQFADGVARVLARAA